MAEQSRVTLRFLVEVTVNEDVSELAADRVYADLTSNVVYVPSLVCRLTKRPDEVDDPEDIVLRTCEWCGLKDNSEQGLVLYKKDYGLYHSACFSSYMEGFITS